MALVAPADARTAVDLALRGRKRQVGGMVFRFGLLATLRQEELLSEANRRQRATNVIRRRRGQTLATRIRRALRAPKR